MRPEPGGDPGAMMAGEMPDNEPGKFAEADEAFRYESIFRKEA
jgi:hypothetical protein